MKYAVGGLLAALATFAKEIFAIIVGVLNFFGCGTLEACNNKDASVVGPNSKPVPEIVINVKAYTRSFTAELDAICEDSRLRQMFSMSPCLSAEITTNHLSNTERVGENRHLIMLHSRRLTGAIEAYVSRLNSENDVMSRETAIVYRLWNQERARNIDVLLEGNPSWGEINTVRLKHSREISAAVRRITAS